MLECCLKTSYCYNDPLIRLIHRVTPDTTSVRECNFVVLQIYPHGSGDLDALLASLPPTAPPASSSPVGTRTDFHRFDLSSLSGMISGMNPFPPLHPVLSESAPRRLTTQLNLPRAHIEEHDLNEHEGRVRGGFPRVSSNTELDASAESTSVQASPFAG